MPKRKRKEKIPTGVLIPQTKITAKMSCRFCDQGRTSDVHKSGELYSLTVGDTVHFYHYFCLLFSSEGEQKGENEGILGFLPKDIEKEYLRGSKISCYICKKFGATINCVPDSKAAKCTRKYHFPCGAFYSSPENEHFFRFEGTNMKSCCPKHFPSQKSIKGAVYKSGSCLICMEDIVAGPGRGRLACNICFYTFHRECLQQQANSSGVESFKCSHCNNLKLVDDAKKLGIYVPQKPADWEEGENAEFYGWNTDHRRYKVCEASRCLCKEGKQHDVTGTKFELYPCDECGGNSIHMECGRLNKKNPSYKCVVCSSKDSDENEDEEEDEDDEIIERSSDQEESDDDDVIMQKFEEFKKVQDSPSQEKENENLLSLREINARKLKEIQDALKDEVSSDDDDDIEVLEHRKGFEPKILGPTGTPLTIKPASSNGLGYFRFSSCEVSSPSSFPSSSKEKISRLTTVKSSESKSPECIRTEQLSSTYPMSTSRPKTLDSFCQKPSSSFSDLNCDKIRAREVKRSEKITLADFPSCSIPNVPAIVSSAERGSPKKLTRAAFPSCSVPNVPQVYSSTMRGTPEEITLTSDEDEPSDETSLDIQICEVIGGEEVEQRARHVYNQIKQSASNQSGVIQDASQHFRSSTHTPHHIISKSHPTSLSQTADSHNRSDVNLSQLAVRNNQSAASLFFQSAINIYKSPVSNNQSASNSSQSADSLTQSAFNISKSAVSNNQSADSRTQSFNNLAGSSGSTSKQAPDIESLTDDDDDIQIIEDVLPPPVPFQRKEFRNS